MSAGSRGHEGARTRGGACVWAWVCAWLALAGALAAADPLEPPPEAPDDADYQAELADSLESGSVELGYGLSGSGGTTRRRTRSVRFNADSLNGTVRDGDGDPLAGVVLEDRKGGSGFEVGRLAPRWGLGLVLGTPAAPWGLPARRGGELAAARSGEGASLAAGVGGARLHGMAGRFGKRSLASMRVERRGLGLGIVGDGGRERQASLGLGRGDRRAEAGVDRHGRWRLESVERRDAGAFRLRVRARAGHVAFPALAGPVRPGPGRALALDASRADSATRWAAVAALWRYRAGVGGTRVALEVERDLRDAGRVVVGVEEQHGLRRDAPSEALLQRSGLRQGWWWEWRAGPPGLHLGLRHESWGARSWARSPIRVVTTAEAELLGPYGCRLRVRHSAFAAKPGETLYLPEAGSDRLVLRALSGVGERTRIDLGVPTPSGTLRASLSLTARDGDRPEPEWTLDWSRRSRLRRR